MKKLLIVLGILFIFTGCSNSKKLDLNSTSASITKDYLTNHEVGDINTISGRYNIKTDNIQDSLIITSKKFDDATMVLILLPKNGKNNEVKSEIEKFIDSYNNQWVGMNYFPDQKELVQNALYTTYGNYLIYIVSSNNDEILKLVKSS